MKSFDSLTLLRPRDKKNVNNFDDGDNDADDDDHHHHHDEVLA